MWSWTGRTCSTRRRPGPGPRRSAGGLVLFGARPSAAGARRAAGHAAGIGRDAVEEFLRRSPADGPERYSAASPAELVPLGVRQVLVHGTEDEAVPVEMSRAYAAAARTAGDTVTLHELPGVGHMELIDPRDPAWRVAANALTDLI